MKAWILAIEAFTVYGLVLWSHSLRHRYGLAFFFALLGCLTAIMSWVTDAGLMIKFGDITFLVGSTVFYTSLLLGVFVVYVFDGPKATRVAILTVVGVSALVPVISLVLHAQAGLSSTTPLSYVPIPSLRINTASLVATLADMVFLAVSWEFLHGKARAVPLAGKAFLALLCVMWLDVVLFNTGAFLGESDYISIMSGTMLSRLIITVFAAPILWAYMSWQNGISGVVMPHRPVFAILQELSDLRVELRSAQEEIQRRKEAEASLASSERRYRQLILHASEPIAVLRNGFYQLHNARLLDLTGIGESDIQQASFPDFVHPGDRETVAKEMDSAQRRLGQARSLEFRAVNALGDPMVIQANMVGIEWDGHGAILAFLHNVTERRRTEKKLIAEATLDDLTGALNRRGFADKLAAEAARMVRDDRVYSLLYLDVDDFKSINDQHGHAAGDLVLKAVTRAAKTHVREGDLIGRMGGDEFAVFLAGADRREAGAVARRILDTVCAACREEVTTQAPGEAREGFPLEVTVSIGHAQFDPANPVTPFELLGQADQALLEAKRHGRNQLRPL